MSNFTKKKILWGLFILAVFTAGYGGAANFPLYEARYLPLHAVDKWLPQIPWTIWIYILEYFLCAWLIHLIDSEQLLKRFIIGFMFCILASIPFFFFYPTLAPRTVPGGTDIHVQTLLWLRSWETARNCFPSLHVSFCYCLTLCFLGNSWKKVFLFLVWTTAIAISTMTTEQHYFIDVVAGFFIGISAFLVTLIWVPYHLKSK